MVGPAGSQEVEAVGPLFAKAGLAFISGSATLPALTTSGANTTFFRVVADDNVQGPQDANYIIKHLQPKARPDRRRRGGLLAGPGRGDDRRSSRRPASRSTTRATTAPTPARRWRTPCRRSVTSQLTSNEHVAIAAVAGGGQRPAVRPGRRSSSTRRSTLFGTDGTDSPSQFTIPGTYVSTFGPDISTSTSPLDKSIVAGVKPSTAPTARSACRPTRRPTWSMQAIASVCKAGQTPTRAQRAGRDQEDQHPRRAEPARACRSAFSLDGDLVAGQVYLFNDQRKGKYVQIPTSRPS